MYENTFALYMKSSPQRTIIGMILKRKPSLQFFVTPKIAFLVLITYMLLKYEVLYFYCTFVYVAFTII